MDPAGKLEKGKGFDFGGFSGVDDSASRFPIISSYCINFDFSSLFESFQERVEPFDRILRHNRWERVAKFRSEGAFFKLSIFPRWNAFLVTH